MEMQFLVLMDLPVAVVALSAHTMLVLLQLVDAVTMAAEMGHILAFLLLLALPTPAVVVVLEPVITATRATRMALMAAQVSASSNIGQLFKNRKIKWHTLQKSKMV